MEERIQEVYISCPTDGTHSSPYLGSDALCQPSPPVEASFLTWALIYSLYQATLHMDILLTVLGLWYLTLSPHGSSSNPPGHLSCSAPLKELRATLVRKEGRGKRRRQGKALYLILLYILSRVCGFAALISWKVFIKQFKKFRNYITFFSPSNEV